jgi:hypothetical protein
MTCHEEGIRNQVSGVRCQGTDRDSIWDGDMNMSGGNLHSRVKAVWQRDQMLRLCEGALVFLRWGLVLFLCGGLIDWLLSKYVTDLPAPVRFVILLAVLGVSLRKAWLAGWKFMRPFNATHTALQIEEQKGGMASLLVTALQLKDPAKRHGTSEALCELTCQKAEESADEIRPKESVRFESLRHPATIALVAILLFGVVAVTNGPLLMAGLSRIFAPWRVVSYPTRTQLELVGGDMVVQEGKPVRIAARISGVVPRRAKIALRTSKGKPRLRKIPITNSECEYEIETAFRGFEYRVTAGDARSAWHKVDVINAPNIERAAVTLEFPEYTKRDSETVEALTLTVPETTRIKWQLALDRAVSEASMILADEEPITMEISADGLTVSSERLATESRAYSFAWVESGHGFAFTSPNNYLQVAPDRPPRVELTSPTRSVFATLGRKLDLAFRGRDDHGIAESLVAYRVDKTEEEKVLFEPVKPIDGTEQVIDWDYRTVLTNLVVGQTVTFAIELSDAYPGENGPHRARTEARRMEFMSMEDYLAQIEKQRKQLLTRLRTLYKEERKVHEAVLRLDRSDPIFVQTCQLEAVRQDLMREGLSKLGGQILSLTDDLAANGVTNRVLIASLNALRSDVLGISTNNLSKSATALRALAGESGRKADLAHAHAAHMVNSAARELGLLVLELGFEDAADVMAREMHAAAETQATLRLRTITAGGDAAALAEEQERLGKWLTRLFEASPKERESTTQDALIEFTLSRIVKHMINGGIATQLSEAATMIRDGKPADAAKIQVGMIASMLKGSFRLRVGAEREALAKAMATFAAQEETQKKLRLEIEALDDKAFKKRSAELSTTQDALHRNLQLLLMPAVPAGRWRLFDVEPRTPPPSADLLGAADNAMTKAAEHIKNGEREAAAKAQANAESSFASLMGIARRRGAAMTQAVRMGRLSYAAKEIDEILARFGERQLSLLEKTEDAAADKSKSAYLADQEEILADGLEELKLEMEGQISRAATPSEHSLSVPDRLNRALLSMRKAVPLLRANKAGEAAAHQESAIAALAIAQELLAEHGGNIGSYVDIVSQTKGVVMASPYVNEIVEEQTDMLELTRKTKPDDLPKLALPQKNLVHAVDAILAALDPIAHLVESGTVMLFAKEDMDAAGEALAIKDDVEALDAQDYIVETLTELRSKVDSIVPQYTYLLELAEAIHETFQEGVLIREAQGALREKLAQENADAAVLTKEQGALKVRAGAYVKLMDDITGLGLFSSCVAHMTEAETLLKGGDDAAAEKMLLAEAAMKSDSSRTLTLVKHLALVMAPVEYPAVVPPGVLFCRKVISMAAKQKSTYRDSYAVKADTLKTFEPKLRELEKACDPFIASARQHKNPVVIDAATDEPIPPANLHLKLVAAKGHLSKAAASAKGGDRTQTLASQMLAAESLRHFAVEYALKFVVVPGPPPPQDPVPSEDFEESEDLLSLFMPGTVSGKRPPDGKLEWDVLGKRDRAALNENFARELPLEYRAILKDYYERLAK